MKIKAMLAALVVLTAGVLAEAGDIKKIDLATGRDGDVNIGAPIFVTEGIAPLRIGAITSAYDNKAKIIRDIGSLFTKGVNAKAGPQLQLGETLAEALRNEAAAMGFRVLGAGDTTTPAWEISGELKNVFADSMQFTGYGALATWGSLDAQLQIRPPGGSPEPRLMRAHTLYATMTGGFGRQDEAEQGLAHLFVVGAQEILARLNAQYFKAASRPEIEAKLKKVTTSGVEDNENDLHMVALAGLTSGAAPLRDLLPREKEANGRQKVIEALALLGSADDVKLLIDRYAAEEERDCQWATFKAMSYIGGDAAMAFVKAQGLKSENDVVKHIAQDLLAP